MLLKFCNCVLHILNISVYNLFVLRHFRWAQTGYYQWGSEIQTSMDFEWSKRGWVANGLDFEWDLKSGSPTI